MRVWYVFLLLLFFAFIFPQKILAASLLQNSGFEDGITSWNLEVQTATASATDTDKHSGNYSLLLTKENSTSYTDMYQRVSVQAGKYYKLSGWVKSNDSAINNVKLRFYWLSDANGSKVQNDPVEVSSGDKKNGFQSLSTDSVLAPTNTSYAEVQVYVYLNEKAPANPALFDDIDFEESSAPTATPQPTAVPTSTPKPTSTPTVTPTPTKIASATSTPTAKLTPTSSLKITLTPTPSTSDKEVLGTQEAALSFVTPTGYPEESEDKAKVLGETTNQKPLIFFGIGGIIITISCGILAFQWWKEKRGKNSEV